MLEFHCRKCNTEPFIPDARFSFALKIDELQNAGCTFNIDDLSIEEWQWLSQLKNAIKEYQAEEVKRKIKTKNAK